MTDFVPANIEAWGKITSLQRFVEAGYLDYAVFDALKSESFELIHSKVGVSGADAGKCHIRPACARITCCLSCIVRRRLC